MTSSDMNDIIEKILEIVKQLPTTNQLELRKELTRMTLNEVDPSALNVASHYIGIMNGLIKDDCRRPSRERKYVNARIVLTHFMYREGLTIERIGQILGRDHSTIVHYRRVMEWVLESPKSDPRLMLLFNKFLKEIE
jgi:chromosomal replication initiation ATPase DnaA